MRCQWIGGSVREEEAPDGDSNAEAQHEMLETLQP
jgi:hypothetical protein